MAISPFLGVPLGDWPTWPPLDQFDTPPAPPPEPEPEEE